MRDSLDRIFNCVGTHGPLPNLIVIPVCETLIQPPLPPPQGREHNDGQRYE
jgi:hypothetical protein